MPVCSKICDSESQDQKQFKLPSELGFRDTHTHTHTHKYAHIYIIFILLIQYPLVVMTKFSMGKIFHLEQWKESYL